MIVVYWEITDVDSVILTTPTNRGVLCKLSFDSWQDMVLWQDDVASRSEYRKVEVFDYDTSKCLRSVSFR